MRGGFPDFSLHRYSGGGKGGGLQQAHDKSLPIPRRGTSECHNLKIERSEYLSPRAPRFGADHIPRPLGCSAGRHPPQPPNLPSGNRNPGCNRQPALVFGSDVRPVFCGATDTKVFFQPLSALCAFLSQIQSIGGSSRVCPPWIAYHIVAGAVRQGPLPALPRSTGGGIKSAAVS